MSKKRYEPIKWAAHEQERFPLLFTGWPRWLKSKMFGSMFSDQAWMDGHVTFWEAANWPIKISTSPHLHVRCKQISKFFFLNLLAECNRLQTNICQLVSYCWFYNFDLKSPVGKHRLKFLVQITNLPDIPKKSWFQWICSKFFVFWHRHDYFNLHSYGGC